MCEFLNLFLIVVKYNNIKFIIVAIFKCTVPWAIMIGFYLLSESQWIPFASPGVWEEYNSSKQYIKSYFLAIDEYLTYIL